MEEEGLSLLDLWKLIMKKKIVASVTFGITTIVVFVLILFVYNPLRTTYQATFFYQWEGIEDHKYANGVVFNEYDIISLTSLNEVKESKTDFDKIDTAKLADHISLEKDKETNNYILKVPGSYFKNDRQAKEFIEALILLPYQKALNLEFDFTSNLSGYQRAIKISHKLNYLQNQMNQILDGYEQMISHFGDVQIEDTNLSNLMKKAEVFQSNNDLKIYEYQAYQNAYMTKEEYASIVKEREVLLTEQELLRTRKQVLLDSLKNIYSNSNGNTYMDTSIANYLNNLHNLDTRLMKIDEDLRLYDSAALGNYNEEASEAFLKTLDAYKTDLEEITNEYTFSVIHVLKDHTILYAEPIETKSRISTLLAIPLSVLLGILAGLFLALIWAYIAEKTKKDVGLK